MFPGKFEHTIDDKGRVSVPVRYREILQGNWNDTRLVITNFTLQGHRCLDVYPLSAWLRLIEQLRNKPQFDPRVVHFTNFYVAPAVEAELDRYGRIWLPPSLREFAGLKRDVVFTPAIDKFRIWDLEKWQQVFQQAETEILNNPSLLQELGV